MRLYNKLLLTVVIAFSSVFFAHILIPPSIVEAACEPGEYAIYDGLSEDCGGSEKNNSEGVGQTLTRSIAKIYNPIAGTLIAFSVLVIIYAGYRFMTSNGEPRRIQLAKNMLLGSGIAIIIILGSYTILRMLLGIIQ